MWTLFFSQDIIIIYIRIKNIEFSPNRYIKYIIRLQLLTPYQSNITVIENVI
jgi:hypothetical protein